MKTLVLGFPRSGTRTMARKLGLGHEQANENGTSDWRLAFNQPKVDRLIHVVRNPIDVISSNLFTTSPKSVNFIKDTLNFPDSLSTLGILIYGWIQWNQQIRSLNPDVTINIETEPEKYNQRTHPQIDFTKLDIPEDLINELKKEAQIYGYKWKK